MVGGEVSVLIRPAKPTDQSEFLTAVRASKALHGPWTRAPSTPKQFNAYLEQMTQPANAGFLVCQRDTGSIVGVINLTGIVLGLFRSGYLGYYAFAGYERQGLMREGLKAVVRYAFKSLKLHRLEANIQPGNVASIALARSCGFSKEGYSPRYLKIGGRWRDHERWAILKPF
jgi:[ribosomal protein S5]-alanine N-acetyltransferase